MKKGTGVFHSRFTINYDTPFSDIIALVFSSDEQIDRMTSQYFKQVFDRTILSSDVILLADYRMTFVMDNQLKLRSYRSYASFSIMSAKSYD